jgi:hypothetical protein
LATIRELLTTFVNTNMATKHKSVRDATIDELERSGVLFRTDSDTVLCIRADAAPKGAIQGSASLPTRITSATATILTALEELVDKGVLDAKALHSRDPGVTMQVI